jgi:penicillin amidase
MRRRGRRKKFAWLRLLLLGLPLLAVAGVLAFYILFRATLPPAESSVSLPGLTAPVIVRFDAAGIPYIKAASPDDAAEALGYLHARDRIFQMDLMRRAASGRLAQWFGPALLDNDEEMRTLGVQQSAMADAAALSPQARAMLQAYASGVNAWIAARGRFAAPEYVLLGRPNVWNVTDSLLWGKTMGLWLSGNCDVQLARLALSQHVKPDIINALWPADPVLMPEATAQAATPDLALAAAGALAWLPRFPAPFTLPENASNEWALAGSHTATGKPLLAGDPHLGFGFPSLWYLVRIDTPQGVLAGATAPGTPLVVIGHNAHLAWTFTTTGASVQDVFIEHASKDGRHYLAPGGRLAFVTRTETIKVAFHRDVVLSVRATRHGPVLGATPDGKALLAVEMANLAPDDTDADGLLALNEAQSVAGAQVAAAKITSPVQNLLVADTAGHIGFFTTGRVPIRKVGDGAWPQDGADGKHDWVSLAGGDALPHSIDPPGGELVNANNPTVGPDFPVFLGGDSYGPWRAARIRMLLDTAAPQTAQNFAAIQLDVTDDLAQEILPRLLALRVPPGDPGAPLAAALRGWSGAMALNEAQPLIFNAWMESFVAAVQRRNKIPPDDAAVQPDNLEASLLGPDASPTQIALICGKTCDPELLDALHHATKRLTKFFGADPAAWSWAQAHPAIFAHPILGRLPYIGGLGRFSIPDPGDADTIDAAAPGWAPGDAAGFAAVHGPELRAVFDLSNLDASRFILAPGQSGNLLSSHAGDLVSAWRDGWTVELGPVPTSVASWVAMSPAE